MKKLIAAYGLKTEHQYYQSILDAFMSNDEEMARDRYLAMPRSHQKMMLKQFIFESVFVTSNTTHKTIQEAQEFIFDLLVK